MAEAVSWSTTLWLCFGFVHCQYCRGGSCKPPSKDCKPRLLREVALDKKVGLTQQPDYSDGITIELCSSMGSPREVTHNFQVDFL
jgi:hypothetical protein